MADPARPAFLDRYEAVGLRHNPFTAPQHGQPASPTFVSRGLPDPPEGWSRTLVQVIGHSGYGKTTQLEHWQSSMPGPHHYIPRAPYRARWMRPPSAGASNGTIYGDEIDRMPSWLRRRWFHELAGSDTTLVIGTHEDLRSPGARAGFTVVTHHLQPFDRATLARVIDLRLQEAALETSVVELFSPNDVDQILAASGGVPEEADVLCHRLLAERVR